MEISLRPYQQEFIDAVRNEFVSGHKRVVGVAPCGAGKTVMTGWMIREALKRGKKSLFFVHRRELIEQTAKTFRALEIPYGIISAGAPMMLERPVQISSVQTLARRLGKIPAPDFLICDECHHILATTYKKVLNAFPKAYLLGVTATPLRMGGVTLADVFDTMVESLSVNNLIELGNLTRFKYCAPATGIDLSGVKIVAGDFDNHALEEVMSNATIVGDIVDNYNKFADGKSAICYCVNVKHSQTVADAFNKAGISAAHCDGETPANERAFIVDGFRRGIIKVLCNAMLFGEGFDVPGCQAVILARPTQSLTLFIQQAMRPLRPDPDDPDKVAVIIDHVKNYLRHGMPNADRDWSLVPNIEAKIKCPHCGRMITPHIQIIDGERRKVCPQCAFKFDKGEAPPTSTPQPLQADGTLSELEVNFSTKKADSVPIVKCKPTRLEEILDKYLEIARQKRHQPQWAGYRALDYAKTYDEMVYIEKRCGFAQYWSKYRWKERCANLNGPKTLQNARLAC